MIDKKHICKELTYCICSSLALEPDENCPIHGYVIKSRCRCGRFVKEEKMPENKIKTFIIPCSWEMYGTIEIEAEDLDEAISIAESDERELPNGLYVNASFQIDYDGLEDYYEE